MPLKVSATAPFQNSRMFIFVSWLLYRNRICFYRSFRWSEYSNTPFEFRFSHFTRDIGCKKVWKSQVATVGFSNSMILLCRCPVGGVCVHAQSSSCVCLRLQRKSLCVNFMAGILVGVALMFVLSVQFGVGVRFDQIVRNRVSLEVPCHFNVTCTLFSRWNCNAWCSSALPISKTPVVVLREACIE